MNQVQQQREAERKDFNLKLRTYSPKVLGYRVNIYGEYHYIVNDIYLPDMAQILATLTALDAKYDEYGFILLQEGYRMFIERHYVYSNRLGRCILTNNTDARVASLAAYRSRKGAIARYYNMKTEVDEHGKSY